MKTNEEQDEKGYDLKIPDHVPSFYEISAQMRLNADILMKEISEHVDKEILRLKKEDE